MNIIRIDKENDVYQKIVSLKENRTKRISEKKFFIEGIQNIKDALSNNWSIDCFICSEFDKLSNWSKNLIRQNNINCYEFSNSLMRNLSEKDDMSELLAIVKMKDEKLVFRDENPFILVFDRPSKKGNLGTILRSADAFGVTNFIFTGHSVDIYDREVIRVSMGSFFKINFKNVKSNNEFVKILEELKQDYSELQIIGTSLQGENYIYETDFKKPTILLIGNEANGLSAFYNSICDKLVKIPMRSGIDSLNVACASSIFMYEVSKQRKN